jgi:serine protease DegQ
VRRTALAIVVVALLAGGCGSSHTSSSSGPTGPRDDWSHIPQIARRLQPSIVTIRTQQGLGSGVVFTKDGVIATDAHVVGTNTSVQVVFADGKESNGRVLAKDPVTDVAAVRVDRGGLPAATFDEHQPALGELAVALGSPLGFSNSVTAGVVSGLGREIPGSASQTQSLVDLVQKDAAISPGNSGGALVNGDGHVIGLAEAYIPPSAGAVSLGFAIPSATVVDVMHQLVANGHVTHAYLGVSPTDITPELQRQLGTSRSDGALVQEVGPNSPAARAGLEPGDIIISLGNKDVRTAEDLVTAIRDATPGSTLPMTFVRNDAQEKTTVTLTDRPTP